MFILVLVVLLIALLIPATIKAKAKSKRIQCVHKLKDIGLFVRVYATDNGDRFPWQTNLFALSNTPPEDAILKYLHTASKEISNPAIFVCPADTRKPADNWTNLTRQNLSYFLGPDAVETYPQSILAGDRNLTTNGILVGPGRVKIDPNNPPTWDATQHRHQGNTLMGDGSVQQLSSRRLGEQLANTGPLTNTGQGEVTFLFP